MARALAAATIARDEAEQARVERDAALRAVRGRLSDAQDELRELTDTAHRDEVARARQLARIEQLQAKALEELGIDPDVVIEDFGPHQLVPHVPGP